MSGEESPGHLRINILPPATANNWTNKCCNDTELRRNIKPALTERSILTIKINQSIMYVNWKKLIIVSRVLSLVCKTQFKFWYT